MLARIRKSAEHKDSGFTLIELLVVMIIIGILAAIAIPAVTGKVSAGNMASATFTTTAGVVTWCATVWNTEVDGASAANPGSATWSYDSAAGLKRGTC